MEADPTLNNARGQLPRLKIKPWRPQEIILAVLSMKWDPGDDLTFGISYHKRIPGADVVAEAVRVADPNWRAAHPLTSPTPWDIPVYQQSYVLVVLDPAIRNWSFWREGIESKGADEAYDFEPFWLEPGDTAPRSGPIPAKSRCRVLYFSVGRRGHKAKHGVDFFVKIRHPDGVREMPMIFDPDVPNEGNGIFP